jgi:CTP:molybdopterin cytidylyltransferase MocA
MKNDKSFIIDMPDCIIAVGGLSSRMKGWKPSLPWGDSTIFEKVVSEVISAGSRAIIAGGYRFSELRELTDNSLKYGNLIFRKSENWRKGMDETVRSALDDVKTEYFFVVPGDMPLISAEVYIRLAELAADGNEGHPVYRPSFSGKPGHPVLMNQEAAGALRNAEPGTPIRKIIHGFRVFSEPWKDESVIRDVDTEADYRLLRP